MQLLPIFSTSSSYVLGVYLSIILQPDSINNYKFYLNPCQYKRNVDFSLFSLQSFQVKLAKSIAMKVQQFQVVPNYLKAYSIIYCSIFFSSCLFYVLILYYQQLTCNDNKIINYIIKQQLKHTEQPKTRNPPMKANFQINLPSIPGKNIKFKIQDIKSASFGTQKARFPDNKAMLTKKFVESFHNFHEPQKDQVQTQAESQSNKSFVKEKHQLQFRSMISENKKFLLPIYASLKKQSATKAEKSLQPNPKVSGGYTFAKAGCTTAVQQQSQLPNLQDTQNNNFSLTQNYYFTNDGEQEIDQRVIKRPRPNAVFKAQSRKVVYDRIYSSVVPGPGAYIKDKPIPKKSSQKAKASKKQEKTGLKDYKHLKQVITKVLVQQNQEQEDEMIESREMKNDHMFVLDDRDRFGDQIFPIAPKLKVPGPGSYQINDSIEDKAKKLVLVEQQRKLLKQWFNN